MITILFEVDFNVFFQRKEFSPRKSVLIIKFKFSTGYLPCDVDDSILPSDGMFCQPSS